MDFGKALEHLKVGKPVRRALWPEDVALRLANVAAAEEAKPVLVLGRSWAFKGDDLLADDWSVVEEK